MFLTVSLFGMTWNEVFSPERLRLTDVTSKDGGTVAFGGDDWARIGKIFKRPQTTDPTAPAVCDNCLTRLDGLLRVPKILTP
jgi:hypothetical protein